MIFGKHVKINRPFFRFGPLTRSQTSQRTVYSELSVVKTFVTLAIVVFD